MNDNKHAVPNQVLRSAETLLELIPAGVVFVDAAGIITYANRRAEEMLGLTRDKLSSLAYNAPVFKSARLDGTPLAEEEFPFSTVKRTKQAVINFQHAILCPDGRRLILSINGAPSLSASGEFLGMIAAIENISELKLAEERLARLTDQVPGVVYQYKLYPDGRSCFPYASSGMNDIYEVTPEEVREDAAIVFKRIHPDDVKNTSDAILESARTLKNFHNELRMVLPRQGLRWRVSDAKPQRMPDGSTLWYGIISDITERKLAEKKQAEMQLQLQQAQKMESVGRLAGGVAHDFNNLLTAIGGYAEFLMKNMTEDDPNREDVKEIMAATERAVGLTKQLLAFSRKQILNPQILDLNVSVAGVAKMIQRLIGEHVRLETKLAARTCQAKLDSGQLDQVLINLAVNARDAMPRGGTLTLQTEVVTPEESFLLNHPAMPRGQLVCLTIRDTGCGMTDEVREHMFEPFFTTKEKGKGTGLGLPTVFGIVKQSGGEIEVESAPDSGTTFRLYFPHIE